MPRKKSSLESVGKKQETLKKDATSLADLEKIANNLRKEVIR